MKINISVRDKASGYLNALPSQVDKALDRALKETLKRLTGYAAKLAAEEYYVKQSEVRKAMHIEPSSLVVRGSKLGLEKFKLSPKRPGKRRYHLMAAVKRGGLKPLGSRSFLMSRGEGYIPFARTSQKRYPIERLYGLAVPQMVGSEKNIPLIEAKAQEIYEGRVDYWLNRITGR